MANPTDSPIASPAAPRRITLVHAGALGDTVLLAPLLRALRLKYPDATISVVLRPAFGQLLTHWGLADAWFSGEDIAASRWFAQGADAQATPWSSCDLLISAVSDGRDAWAAHARQLSTAGQMLFFAPRPDSSYPRHATQYHREQLAALDLPEAPLPLPVVNPDGPLLIHPGSGGEAKCWPRERYLELGRALLRNGIRPTFVLGQAEQERWDPSAVAAIQAEFPSLLDADLQQLADKTARARLYLGNDSGASQVAGFMGIPTLVLFGPSNDVQWRPWGPQVRVMRPPEPHRTDLSALSVEAVLARVMSELRRLGAA